MKLFILTTLLLFAFGQSKANLKSSLGNLVQGLTQTFLDVSHQGGQLAGDLLGHSLMVSTGSLVDTDVLKLIDSLVHGDAARRDVSDFRTKIEQIVKGIIAERKDGISAVASAAVNQLQSLANSFGDAEFLGQPISNVVDKIDDVVGSHHVLSNALLGNIIIHIKNAVRTELGKLNIDQTIIDDVTQKIGSSSESILKPDIDLVQEAIATFGHSLKKTATKLMTVFQKHASATSTDVLTSDARTEFQNAVTEGQQLIQTLGQKATSAMTNRIIDAIVAQHKQN